MSWLKHHRVSERCASEADVAARRGEVECAKDLYATAAKAESRALDELGDDKPRAYGIIAVSAVALYYKARLWQDAQELAYRSLGSGRLPKFAWRQIEDLLSSIKLEQMELDESHARRIAISVMIRESYKPWIFQAEPGSYRFEIALQTRDHANSLHAETNNQYPMISTLADVLRTCAEAPMYGLANKVPDIAYRSAFLKSVLDLTPTGDDFDLVDIRYAEWDKPVILTLESRWAISEAIEDCKETVEEWDVHNLHPLKSTSSTAQVVQSSPR